jgi:hypothetical protein
MSDSIDFTGLSRGQPDIPSAFFNCFFDTLRLAQISEIIQHNLRGYATYLREQHIKSSLTLNEYRANSGVIKLVA